MKMLKLRATYGLLWLWFFLFVSCELTPEVSIFQIEPELEPYVNRFFAEAEKRGIELPMDNLIVEFGDTGSATACGLCRFTPSRPERQVRVIINKSSSCWMLRTDLGKEGLVFHELAHCLLKRHYHRDDLLPDGSFASLLNSIDSEVYVARPCFPVGGVDVSHCKDNRFKREYYLNELFDPVTPIPEWAK